MAKLQNSLDHVKIAAPCSAGWDEMLPVEGERVRFCYHCKRNVYNLSEMTRGEATSLVYHAEGRLCVKFYRRSDGTILTQNCPVGLRALKKRLAWVAQVLFGMLLSSLAMLGLLNIKDRKALLDPRESGLVGKMVPIPFREMGELISPISEKETKEDARKERAQRNQ